MTHQLKLVAPAGRLKPAPASAVRLLGGQHTHWRASRQWHQPGTPHLAPRDVRSVRG